MKEKLRCYIVSIAIPLAVGGFSALFTRGGMELYAGISKPPLSPPGIVFPIVWTVLYVLMGIGMALVYMKRDDDPDTVRSAVFVFGLQLAANFFWSIIFFNMQAYLFAFIWLLLLLALVIWMALLFRRVSRTAAYIQLPYIIWVIFAGYLTLMVSILNK